MRDDEDEPLFCKLFEQKKDALRVLLVERPRGLVGKDELGLQGEHPCNGDALLFTAGKRARAAGGVFLHADGAQELCRPLLRNARKADVFLCREIGIEADVLKDIAAHGPLFPEGDAPLRGLGKAAQEI